MEYNKYGAMKAMIMTVSWIVAFFRRWRHFGVTIYSFEFVFDALLFFSQSIRAMQAQVTSKIMPGIINMEIARATWTTFVVLSS